MHSSPCTLIIDEGSDTISQSATKLTQMRDVFTRLDRGVRARVCFGGGEPVRACENEALEEDAGRAVAPRPRRYG